MWLFDGVQTIRDFLDTGGPVVFLIMGVTFAMWVLILERLWYFRFVLPTEVHRVQAIWHTRADRTSWHARQIRRLLISQLQLRLSHSLSLIRTLVALCPLLGILGTVTGMIEVFDVMASVGSSSPRAMAAGVYRATIPTMAGMVAALSGLIFSFPMDRFASKEGERLADRLTSG